MLAGPNGIGKSTLLQSLAGGTAKGAEILPDVRVGYYRQDFSNLDFDKTVYQELSAVLSRPIEEEVRRVAAGFLITGELFHSKIGTLSEGQKGLVAFARLALLQTRVAYPRRANQPHQLSPLAGDCRSAQRLCGPYAYWSRTCRSLLHKYASTKCSTSQNKYMHDTYDVIVVGGGPAGMMAAGRAAARGKKVLLLEKNRALGEKLKITGGGRCNITNAELEVHQLLRAYGKAEQFLYSTFAQFGVADTFSFFESRGLPLVIEARKRAFPKTQKALDVCRVLEAYIKKCGVEVQYGNRSDPCRNGRR